MHVVTFVVVPIQKAAQEYTIIKMLPLLSSPPKRRARVARDTLFGRFLEGS